MRAFRQSSPTPAQTTQLTKDILQNYIVKRNVEFQNPDIPDEKAFNSAIRSNPQSVLSHSFRIQTDNQRKYSPAQMERMKAYMGKSPLYNENYNLVKKIDSFSIQRDNNSIIDSLNNKKNTL